MPRYLELDQTGSRWGPDFTTDIWPLLEQRSTEIDEVFLFRARKLRRDRLFREFPEIRPGVFALGAFAQLDARTEGTVNIRSHYGGHLDVLYRTKSISLLHSLVDLWPFATLREDGNLGLDADDLAAFEATVEWLASPGVAAFAFFHDGFPLLVFGSPELLASLEERHAQMVSMKHRTDPPRGRAS